MVDTRPDRQKSSTYTISCHSVVDFTSDGDGSTHHVDTTVNGTISLPK